MIRCSNNSSIGESIPRVHLSSNRTAEISRLIATCRVIVAHQGHTKTKQALLFMEIYWWMMMMKGTKKNLITTTAISGTTEEIKPEEISTKMEKEKMPKMMSLA